MTLRIDTGRIEQRILFHATTGLRHAAEHALARAKRHAPVRKLNRLTKYRTGKGGFREPQLRQLITPARGAAGSQRIRSHANARDPFIQVRQGNVLLTFMGDFRRVEETKGGKFRLRAISEKSGDLEVYSTIGGRVKRVKLPDTELRLGDIRTGRIKSVNAKGRYEIKSGRANFTEGGVTRVGGRLRGELHTQGPVTGKGGVIWMYVRSATKDPKTGRLYPRDQEFGTSHHPPHPFLRPALHESRGALRRMTRAAIVRGLRKG